MRCLIVISLIALALNNVDCQVNLGKSIDSLAARFGQDPNEVRAKLVEMIDNVRINSDKTIDNINKNREEALPQLLANVLNGMDLVKNVIQKKQDDAHKMIKGQEAVADQVVEAFRNELPNLKVELPKNLALSFLEKGLEHSKSNGLFQRRKREVSAEEVKNILQELEEKPLDKKILVDLSTNKELFNAVHEVIGNAAKTTSSVVNFVGAVANAGVDSLKTAAVHRGSGLNQFLNDRMNEIKANIDKTAENMKKELAPVPTVA